MGAAREVCVWATGCNKETGWCDFSRQPEKEINEVNEGQFPKFPT